MDAARSASVAAEKSSYAASPSRLRFAWMAKWFFIRSSRGSSFARTMRVCFTWSSQNSGCLPSQRRMERGDVPNSAPSSLGLTMPSSTGANSGAMSPTWSRPSIIRSSSASVRIPAAAIIRACAFDAATSCGSRRTSNGNDRCHCSKTASSGSRKRPDHILVGCSDIGYSLSLPLLNCGISEPLLSVIRPLFA